jgi:tetratricopeptide (TPR) repeat protein
MPDSPEALAVRARARIVRGESELAILDAKRAAQAAETNFDILVVAGDANANASRYAEALAYYGAALDLNPDSIDALKRIAQTQRDMGRTQTALKTEELIARLSNTYTETRLGGAVISGGRSALEKALNKAIQENRHQDAIALFNKLIEDKLYGEDESLYHTTYQNRGALYLQMRNYVAAAADLEKAISLQSKLGEVNPATAGNLGDAYYKLEKFDKSVEFLTLGLKFQPDNIGWLYTRALSLRRIQGGFEDALADLARVLEIKPNYCPAFNVRGIIFSNAAQNKQGIEEFTKAINCDPKRAAYYRARAALYQLTGQINKASSDLQTAKALGGG